jgi:arylsulfatase A-like enzyme
VRRRQTICATYLTACLAAWSMACGRAEGPRPSILLFVVDTLRADAVSAYGHVAGTTPTIDALATEGVRYARAYANAPWTLPSHVTLFTGLLPYQHGVGWEQTRVPDSLPLLAEHLRSAGYDTVGISENPWVSDTFNVDQGFDRFSTTKGEPSDLMTVLTDWFATREPGRPFFLFINVVDPHWPYAVRERNPFLPPGVSQADADVMQWPPEYMCADSSKARAYAIQHGLYLGDVAAADDKLRRVRERLSELLAPLVTIVTSDHGEHFGEHGLASHQFSVREVLLRVPLVIHGLDAAPGVIDTPVQLADITPTILQWLGLRIPPQLAGRPLPEDPREAASARDLMARYLDPRSRAAPDEPSVASLGRAQAQAMRTNCRPDHRVWGDMRALIRYPLKLIWFARFPPELYDLARDPGERRDLAARFPALTTTLASALRERVRNRQPRHPADDAELVLPAEVLDRLKALGYVPPD